jgi:hypothetical protein
MLDSDDDDNLGPDIQSKENKNIMGNLVKMGATVVDKKQQIE